MSLPLEDDARVRAEAAAFRKLVAHLQQRALVNRVPESVADTVILGEIKTATLSLSKPTSQDLSQVVNRRIVIAIRFSDDRTKPEQRPFIRRRREIGGAPQCSRRLFLDQTLADVDAGEVQRAIRAPQRLDLCGAVAGGLEVGQLQGQRRCVTCHAGAGGPRLLEGPPGADDVCATQGKYP